MTPPASWYSWVNPRSFTHLQPKASIVKNIVHQRLGWYHFARMFKALSLIVYPQAGWERIASERRSLGFVLLQYFLPMILIVLIGEGLGMMAWRHWYAGANGMMHFTPDQVLVFEAMRLPLVPLAILACGHIVWLLREPFHAQYTYSEGLMLIAYALCPLFLTYFLDGIPWINLWIS